MFYFAKNMPPKCVKQPIHERFALKVSKTALKTRRLNELSDLETPAYVILVTLQHGSAMS